LPWFKSLEKTLKPLQTTAMQAQSLRLPVNSTEDLVRIVIHAAMDSLMDGHIAEHDHPQTSKDFDALVLTVRGKVSLLAQEWSRRVQTIVTEAAAAHKKIASIKAHKISHDHLLAQWERLFHKQVWQEAFDRLGHYPRYLQGMGLRCDKCRSDPARDQRLLSELSPLWAQYQRLRSERKGQTDASLDHIRWLLEELHVSLFAQELKTPTPVSVKRIQKAFEAIKR